MNQTTAQEIYIYIREYINANNGLSPTVREIAKNCHMNISTVARYLDVLEAQERITRLPNTSRSIRIAAK